MDINKDKLIILEGRNNIELGKRCLALSDKIEKIQRHLDGFPVEDLPVDTFTKMWVYRLREIVAG